MKFTLPHDPFTPLDPVSKPTPSSVRLLRQELYANVCSVPSDLGGGGHGHLGMVMPQAAYTAISVGGAIYVPPALPNAPAYQGAAAVIANPQLQYELEKKAYYEYRDLSNQIKAMMLVAVPGSFIRPLRHPQLGFANATPQAIMDHLLQTFGEIKASDLQKNLKDLELPWNPDTPIEDVFARGTFCRDFAEEGEDPITDATYTRYLVQTFEKSGVLEKAVEDWEKKPKADQTLANCEIHFTEANSYRLTKLAKESKDVLAANNATKTKVAETKVLKEKDIHAL
jgi:hypothetical protein